MNPKNILFTGLPGCGKTTLVEAITRDLGRPVCGFLTREIRQRGVRVGFSIETFCGKSETLAHRDFTSQWRVGPYGVDLKVVDRLAVPSLVPTCPEAVIVIDEIGKMECFSSNFRRAVTHALDSNHLVFATISLHEDAYIQAVKNRLDVMIRTVNEKNRKAFADPSNWHRFRLPTT